MHQHITFDRTLLVGILTALVVPVVLGVGPHYFKDPEEFGILITRLSAVLERGKENERDIRAHGKIPWHSGAQTAISVLQQRANQAERERTEMREDMREILGMLKINSKHDQHTQRLLHEISREAIKKLK